MQFRNPSTGTYYTATWNDSDNPSPYVRDQGFNRVIVPGPRSPALRIQHGDLSNQSRLHEDSEWWIPDPEPDNNLERVHAEHAICKSSCILEQ